MRKKIHLIYVIILVLFLHSCKQSSQTNEDIYWMSKISNIKISKNWKLVKFYNNNEWGMIAKYQIDSLNMSVIFNKYHFKKEKKSFLKLKMAIDIEDNWLENNYSNTNTDYYYFEDCHEKNTWLVLVNKKTNELWFEVLYPDFSGDSFDCRNKDSIQ